MFRLAENLPYVVNPASGLRVKEMQVSLVTNAYFAKSNPNVGDFTVRAAQPSDPTFKTIEISTPFVDVGCLAGKVFHLPKPYYAVQPYYDSNYYPQGELPGIFTTGGIYVKLLINLERINPTGTNQNSLMILTYHLDQNRLTLGGPEAGMREPYPADDINLFGPLPACTNTLTPPVSTADVTNFCQSDPTYNAAIALRGTPGSAGTRAVSSNSTTLSQFSCYPNPLRETGTIQFSVEAEEQVHIYLVNEVGTKVRDFTDTNYYSGFHKLSFDTQGLNSGIYHCILQSPSNRKVLKLVIIK